MSDSAPPQPSPSPHAALAVELVRVLSTPSATPDLSTLTSAAVSLKELTADNPHARPPPAVLEGLLRLLQQPTENTSILARLTLLVAASHPQSWASLPAHPALQLSQLHALTMPPDAQPADGLSTMLRALSDPTALEAVAVLQAPPCTPFALSLAATSDSTMVSSLVSRATAAEWEAVSDALLLQVLPLLPSEILLSEAITQRLHAVFPKAPNATVLQTFLSPDANKTDAQLTNHTDAAHNQTAHAVDAALRMLLARVPALAMLMPSHAPAGLVGEAAHTLRTLAKSDPAGVRTRARALKAAARTILTGLEAASSRYGRSALDAVATIFEVLADVDLAPLTLIHDALFMLLDEQRDVNGVPDMFAALAQPVLKIVQRHAHVAVCPTVDRAVRRIAHGRKTSGVIREAAVKAAEVCARERTRVEDGGTMDDGMRTDIETTVETGTETRTKTIEVEKVVEMGVETGLEMGGVEAEEGEVEVEEGEVAPGGE